MTIERINFLFQNGFITEDEHQELISANSVNNKLYTRANYLTLILALTGYFFMLTFTKDGHEFTLLSNGNERLWAGTIFSTLSLGIFIESKKYRRNVFIERSGYGYIGLGVALCLLLVVIPVWIMSEN